METQLVKKLRDAAALRTKGADNPFEARTWTLEWEAASEIERLEINMKRLWHFAGCPFDHCETCIADAKWIKGLEAELGPPSADAVIAQHEDR